jgi:hypothetical protein
MALEVGPVDATVGTPDPYNAEGGVKTMTCTTPTVEDGGLGLTAQGPSVSSGMMLNTRAGRPLARDRTALSKLALIDETVRDPGRTGNGYYQLTAALVDGPAVSLLRVDTLAVAPAGGFHASELAARQQHHAVDRMLHHVVRREECWSLIAVTEAYRRRGEQEQARARCLTELLVRIDASGISHVVVDSREVLGPDPESRNRNDLATLAALRRSGRVNRHMTLEHKHDSHEPVLWLPDAVGWAFRQHELRSIDRFWTLVSGATTVCRL